MSSYVKPCFKTYCAEGAITQYSFVKFGSGDDKVVLSGAAEKAFGIFMASNDSDAVLNDAVEIAHLSGGALIKLAGPVTRGDSIASDASGLGVLATAGQWAPAIAMESGVAGDIIGVILNGHQAI